MNKTFILFLSTLFFISCEGSLVKDRHKNNDKDDKDDKNTEQEKIKEPADIKVYELPKELKEISGISFIDNNTLVSVQDEKGQLYFYDLLKEEVTEKREFGKDGDYEDVAVVDNDIYVLTSAGKLHYIKNFKSGNSKAEIFDTPFSGKNNLEGLAYDKNNNRLLMAVKDEGLDTDKDDKDIYAFDLKTKKLASAPVYAIRLPEIEEYYKGDALEEASKKFLKAIGNQNMNEVFRPSALDIHPRSGNIYVLSSINNMIAVLTPGDGKISKIIELKGKEFIQPEGLSFTASGDLYISNEGKGKGDRANIIKITYED